ncbi:hypothetical protein ACI5KX_02000 [Erythrobacter sp. GH1-10]|uniref:hypothetical protein n=1 Tax=Erythrobacter sp. GH1-10 TaxID=3349334 RepID=UPI003877E4F3
MRRSSSQDRLADFKRFPVLTRGFVWLGAAKALSAACILLQATVFSLFLPEPETQSAFFFLAVVSLLGQAAIALPVILISQYAWLADGVRARKYLGAFILFAGTLMVLAAIWLLLPITDVAGTTAALVIATACVAAIPNLCSIERFAVGDFKGGALFSVFNVLIPQVLASAAAIWQGTAIAWLTGLATGHGVALLLIVLVTASRRSQARPSGKRPPIKLDLALLGSTFAWLFFVWSLPNLPRVALADAQASAYAAQLLVLASISFAVSNAFETLVAQLRRGNWLGWFEGDYSGEHRATMVSTELRGVGLIAALLLGPIAVTVFAAGHFLLFRGELVVSFALVALVVTCDLLRSLCSISYLVSEAGRTQARLSPWIAVTTLAAGTLLAQLDVLYLERTFVFVAIILLLCCVILAISCVRLAGWQTESPD